MNDRLKGLVWPLICGFAFAAPLISYAKDYTMNTAIEQAQAVDPWLDINTYQEAEMKSESISAGAMPDPMIRLGIANMPVDSFDMNQEGMSQYQIGITQEFPRGRSLELEQQKRELLSDAFPYERKDRKAKLAVTVAQTWLEVYRFQRTIQLIEEDRGLFEHLVDLTESLYSSASIRTRQHDLIRAQLELTGLEDRLIRLQQKREMQLAQLRELLQE